MAADAISSFGPEFTLSLRFARNKNANSGLEFEARGLERVA